MRLKTLGELSLEGADFKQSRPLLLLAYLCLEGAQERRHIAELFWPQSPNAVRNLTTVLSRLNKVDADLIAVEGHALHTSLTCDVTELVKAFEKQAYDKVLSLYQGRFLEGFYLKDIGAELEEWLYARRETLATKVRFAKLSQAEQKAEKGLFQDAAKEAEQAYLQAGAGEPTESDLERIYKLLVAGDSQLAHDVKKEAQTYGLELSLNQEEAQQQFTNTLAQSATETLLSKATQLPHNLPKQATPFVGRTLELQHLAKLLIEPSCQLLSIVGPGGMGKTRLALATAEAQVKQARFKDGVVFVSFVSVSSVDLMIPALGDALGLAFAGQLEPKTQLLTHLADKALILVLDNLEHLLEGVDLLADLLSHAPNVTVLATSREPLNIQAEQLFELAGLNTPGEDHELAYYDAVELFIQSVQRRKPDFLLTEDSSQAIKVICQLVGGMPLALELAANWIRVLSIDAIATEIASGIDLLTANKSDLPERHRSIRAVFDHSWQFLSHEEQKAMRQLAVFRGGFTREAAQEVAGVTLIELANLIDRSLLNLTPSGRYRRHPLVIQYSQEKLAEHPEEQQQLDEQHGQYFVNLMQEQEQALRSLRRKDALTKLEEDLPNIKKAWDWVITHKQLDAIADISPVLPQLLFEKPREAVEMYQQAREQLSETNPKHYQALGRLYSNQARSQILITPPDQSLDLSQQGLDFSRQAGDSEGIVQGLFLLGRLSEADKAMPILEEGLSLARQIGSQEVGYFLCTLLLFKRNSAGFDEANAYYKEVIKELRELKDPIPLVYGLTFQGSFLIYYDHLEEGQAILEEGLRLCRKMGLDSLSSVNFSELALLAYKQGDVSEDARLSKEAYQVAKAFGHPLVEAQAMTGLGRAAFGLNQLAQARSYFKQALTLAIESKHPQHRLLHTLTWFGVLYFQEDKFEKSVELLSFVNSSPLTERRDQLESKQQLAKLESKLSAEAFEKARTKGESLKFEEVVQEVLLKTP